MSAPFPVIGDADYCPHCGASMNDKPIPEDKVHLYGGGGWFKREVGMEVRGTYDGVLYWFCPDCGLPWHRWPVGSFQYQAAEPVMRKHADEVTALSDGGRARLAELTAESAQPVEQPADGS